MEKQGQSLACWFEQTMELWDASDEEAPTTNPRKKDLTKGNQLEAISMLMMMATEDHLQRGAIMDIAKGLNMACSMIYRLWDRECTEHMHATGIINSPEPVSSETILGECLSISLRPFRRVSRMCC